MVQRRNLIIQDLRWELKKGQDLVRQRRRRRHGMRKEVVVGMYMAHMRED